MKKLLMITAGVVLINLAAFGQGSVLFQNVGPGLNAGIKDSTGTLIPAGSAFTAELLAGTTAANVGALTPAIMTTTWVGNGWFGVGQPEKVLQGFAPGATPFLQVRAWDNAGGTITSYAAAVAGGKQAGASTIWQLAATGGLGNPGASPAVPGPALLGMQPFQLSIVPEPSTIALGLLGAAALFLRRRK